MHDDILNCGFVTTLMIVGRLVVFVPLLPSSRVQHSLRVLGVLWNVMNSKCNCHRRPVGYYQKLLLTCEVRALLESCSHIASVTTMTMNLIIVCSVFS